MEQDTLTEPVASVPHEPTPPEPACRFCGDSLEHVVVDLGMSPLCESYLAEHELDQMEPFYPLRLYVCDGCYLVQLREYVSGQQIFEDYAYFSSYSDSWVEHARRYAETMIGRFELGASSFVVELASNDGYLLRHFVERNVPCLGIEPARNVASVAEANGVPTLVEFFGRALAERLANDGLQADLIVANNVLAQVANLNDFVAGIPMILAPDGVLTLEFPHLSRLVTEHQFDTIYHEHFSYFSWLAVQRILSAHGLQAFDVEELSTHGGSLRVHAGHVAAGRSPSVAALELTERERREGVESLGYYSSFACRVEETKRRLLTFLIEARDSGKVVVGYGAPGKGNTLLNYCGIRSDLLSFTVDRSPHKQGKYLPGTHIPIHAPDRIDETRPDYVLILPWNLRNEITAQMAHVRDWGGRFVVPIPSVEVLE
ncbi:MAG: class I SAM-dependent methyltransferase [Gemmatimonadota bacterium]|nr:class I SAM-dependent methyltransferase [Gemmatimonadota bacterium]MDH3426984.1 class I SAM-dependent methyltransferase [Gemmatimonadota bacterium]